MMYLLDLALGSLYSLGPAERRKAQQRRSLHTSPSPRETIPAKMHRGAHKSTAKERRWTWQFLTALVNAQQGPGQGNRPLGKKRWAEFSKPWRKGQNKAAEVYQCTQEWKRVRRRWMHSPSHAPGSGSTTSGWGTLAQKETQLCRIQTSLLFVPED